MARRRRRITIKNSSLFALIILNLLISSSVAYYHNNHHHHLNNNSQHHHHHHVRSNHQQPHNNNNNDHHHHHQNHHHDSQQIQNDQYRVMPLSQNQNQNQEQQYSKQQQQQQQQQSQQVATTEKSFSTAHMCRLLPAHIAKQLKLCKLTSYSLNADDAVSLGTQKGLAECRNQFKAERWNCTHSSGDEHLLTSDLAQSIGNKESGFVHAIAAAGIVHSIATACSVGNLTDCACDKSRMGLIRKREENWTWGGCSKDIRYGMMFAKHLVELLDAVHQHSRLLAGSTSATTTLSIPQSNKQHYQHRRILEKRSLSSKNREPNQLRGRQDQDQYPNSIVQQQQQPQQQQSFCQRSHNISQTTHIQLIKSLLSKNSLEKHQEFRLAMNMHNNKVGRMAIAKNMAYMCRCHGLSGSCTLKTCWVILPDFQRIGAYLKEKYQASVHLPTAVNVNKLIPMMDRNEISAILSSGSGDSPPLNNNQIQIQDQPQPQLNNQVTSGGLNIGIELPQHRAEILQQSSKAVAATDANNEPVSVSVPIPEFSPLVWGQSMDTQEAVVAAATPVATATVSPPIVPARISGHLITPSAPVLVSNANLSSSGLNPTNIPAHYNFYERHKQLEKAASLQPVNAKKVSSNSGFGEEELIGEVGETISVKNITPMTQDQYQSLLKELKLCNNQTALVIPSSTTSYLATRDLNQQQVYDSLPVSSQQKHKIGHKHNNKHNNNNNLNNQLNNNQQHSLNSQHLKSANQHLSQLLSSKKDDLIHLHKSPDYCEADIRHGFVGIQSRTCSENPSSPDSCDKLCCGRGYKTRVFKHSFRCDCKFQYCCSIYCSVCDEVTQVTLCN